MTTKLKTAAERVATFDAIAKATSRSAAMLAVYGLAVNETSKPRYQAALARSEADRRAVAADDDGGDDDRRRDDELEDDDEERRRLEDDGQDTGETDDEKNDRHDREARRAKRRAEDDNGDGDGDDPYEPDARAARVVQGKATLAQQIIAAGERARGERPLAPRVVERPQQHKATAAEIIAAGKKARGEA